MNAKALQALGNPLRIALLDALARETTSPKRLSDAFSIRLSNLSHHVSVLKDAGLIEEVGRRDARGSTEHFYRTVVPDPLSWVPTVVDSVGRVELDKAIEKLLAETQLVQKRSAKRLAQTGRQGLAATVVVTCFERDTFEDG